MKPRQREGKSLVDAIRQLDDKHLKIDRLLSNRLDLTPTLTIWKHPIIIPGWNRKPGRWMPWTTG